jgi:1,4-alpha-glucan branching enzyme
MVRKKEHPEPGRRPKLKRGNRAKPPEATLLTEDDLYLFNEGTDYRIYEKLGAHPFTVNGQPGTYFAVWAPDAKQVSVIGDFNGWDRAAHPLQPRGQSGIWEGFIAGVGRGTLYKYHIVSRYRGLKREKADPLAIYSETPPKTASIVWDLQYDWGDQEWLAERGEHNAIDKPLSIYEVHLGSWQRVSQEGHRPLTYRELALKLTDYVKQMGFTHVEFLPVMEHPFFGSWGYQITGYFAPTSRYGSPQDFMYLIDCLHQQGIGVILDWVPSHFPTDDHGLGLFDGTHLYEHADPKKGFHPDWKSYIFNYGRSEIQSFLISSALFWLGKYHVDGLRVDAVASMLYLDYSRKDGEWIPNKYGGRENLEAITFLRRLNEAVYKNYPDVQTIAEESTAWPMVSRPTYLGGLGFGMKWDMGWMHDTLQYMSRDPIYRKYHHNNLTFRMLYAFHENFVLPLSHDEVVHGKGSLIAKMPGDDWQKFANLRLLLGYMYSQPGKKLLFMGDELGQWREWDHDGSPDWHFLDYRRHAEVQNWVKALNRLYQTEPALYELDCDPAGFEWIDASDALQSVISFMRRGKSTDDILLVICNFTPTTHFKYQVGVPRGGFWKELLNSDTVEYGGSGQDNPKSLRAIKIRAHGRPYSLEIRLPPLAVLYFKSRRQKK